MIKKVKITDSIGPWVGLSLRDFEAVGPEFFINLVEFSINPLKKGSLTKCGFTP